MVYAPASDKYSQYPKTLNSPARNAVAVVTSDTVDLSIYAKKLWIGVTGDVKVILVGDLDAAPVTFKAVPVGWLEVQVRRVFATGTTATNIVAVYDA